MEIDVNFKNQDKHWILVILGKVKNLFLLILKYLIIVLKRLVHFVQKSWKILVGIAALIIIVPAVIWGYDYYKNTYIPKKLLDDAIADINLQFQLFQNTTDADYAYNLLQSDTKFGYEGVQDYKIRERIQDLYKPAFEFIEKQAFTGDAKSQYLLGQLYFHQNKFVSKDEKKAVYWWNEAANQDYTKAFNNIGVAYLLGIGVASDMQLAVKWLRKGAEAGEESAQKNYGDLFLEGVWIKVGSHKELREKDFVHYNSNLGEKVKQYFDYTKKESIVVYKVEVDDFEQLIPKDIEQAKYWWKKAAAQGHQPAIDALQKIY